MPPVAIALCGKSSGMASSFAKSMLPEYETSVHRELPALLKGTKVAPESDVGSNSESGAAVPRAVVVGAGFSEAELDDMRKIEGGNQVPWLYPDPVKSAASMVTGPFLMTVIVKRVKACLKANGVVEGSEAREEERGVWSF